MERVSILLAGEAGQGVQAVENLLARVLQARGWHVFATKEYMSRIRGGANSTTITVSTSPVRAWHEKADLFVPFSREAAERYRPRRRPEALALAEQEVLPEADVALPLSALAAELASPLYANSLAAGALLALLDVPRAAGHDYLKKAFAAKGEAIVNKNVTAFDRGYALGAGGRRFPLPLPDRRGDRVLWSGADAVALGAVAGGCNACFAYPMTPSTAVFTNLAAYSKNHDLVVEQVEDEIAAINMALGCWYAGGRALVTTSGGGFALMTEGLSLAGMTETPVVIHLAGRPGPATGLPTRTEQGDLNLALYAGHGVFPRILLAPGSLEQAFEFSARAFVLADRYQVPVFILTDQYFIDSYYDVERPKNFLPPQAFIVETAPGYRRYEITEDGLSPRGIPGFGRGLVTVDSDEHDPEGRITEDLSGIGLQMKEKRLRKFRTVAAGALAPVLYGDENYHTLLVAWGSTHNLVLEAMKAAAAPGVAFLFPPQLYPLHPQIIEHLKRARKLIAIENNTTGQLADLLEKEVRVEITERILRYDGLPFSVEGLTEALKERL